MTALLTRRPFDGLHAHRTAGASGKVLASPHCAKFMETTYAPGKSRFLEGELNVWSPTTLRPAAGPFPNIEALLNGQFSDPAQLGHFLDCLASIVQRPGVKIKHLPILRGPQGSGKNTLVLKVIAPMVGQRNTRCISGDALLSKFTVETVNIGLLVVDEVMQREGWEAVNRLKPLVTEDRILFEAKGESRRWGTTPGWIIMMSNEHFPIPIESGDRRFFVTDYGPPKLDPLFFQELYGSLDTEVPAFFATLLARDITSFNPNAAPPMTQAKAEMQASVRPPLERQLRDWLDHGFGPFAYDIVLVSAVLHELKAAGYTNTNEGSITTALKSLGAKSLGQLPPRPSWGSRLRCWAVRNHAMWGCVGPAAWAAHLAQLTPENSSPPSAHTEQGTVVPFPFVSPDQDSELSKSMSRKSTLSAVAS